MKKILLLTALVLVALTAAGQNEYRYLLKARGGITVGGTYGGANNITISKINTIDNGKIYMLDANGDTVKGVYQPIADRVDIADILDTMAIGSDLQIEAMIDAGAEIRGKTMFSDGGETLSLTDGRVYYVLCYVYKNDTINNVNFVQTTAGDYTADANNYIALYSVEADTLTQVAITANNGNLWKGTAGSFQTAAFATPYVATEGLYAIGFIYNSSAQTTAPQIAGSSNVGYMWTGLLPNHIALVEYVASQTELPTSYTYTGTNNPGTIAFITLSE